MILSTNNALYGIPVKVTIHPVFTEIVAKISGNKHIVSVLSSETMPQIAMKIGIKCHIRSIDVFVIKCSDGEKMEMDNKLSGEVESIERFGVLASVAGRLKNGVKINALLAEDDLRSSGLTPGEDCYFMFSSFCVDIIQSY